MATMCLAPPDDAGFVRSLLGSVDCGVQTMSEAAYGSLAQPSSPLAAALTAMLTLYIGFMGFRLLVGRAPLRVSELTVSALKIGVVLALATSWPTYQQLVFDTLFRGPEQLAASMLDNVQPSDSAFRANPFDGLQLAYDELQRAAAWFSQRSVTSVSPLQGGTAGAAFALNAAAFLMLVTTLGMVLAAKIVLGLLLGLGPVFVALLLFDTTRGIFEGWLRAAIAFALAPMLAVLGLVVQLTLIEPQLVQLAALRAESVADTAPASAIFLLTLVSTMVSGALAIAVGSIAAGLRLGGPSRSAEGKSGALPTAASVTQVEAARIAGSSAASSQPRANAIAAAAAAMDRREARAAGDTGDGPRRLVVAARREDAAPASYAPIGQSYRRSAQPPRAASNVRRDR